MKRFFHALPNPIQHALRVARSGTRLPLELLPNAPDLFRGYRSFAQHPALTRKPGGWLYQGQFYPDHLTMGGASHAITRTAQHHCHGVGIDVGAGLWPLPCATPVDIWRGPGAGRTLDDIVDGSLDFVFSSHCLEHIAAWQQALHQWVGKLKPGGVLFLYLPHPDCALWHPGSPFVGDDHKWVPTPVVVKQALVQCGCTLVASDDGPDAMQSFFVCGRKQP